MDQPLWQPSAARIKGANITRFTEMVAKRWDVALDDYGALHRWSIDERQKFWLSLWDFGGVIAETKDTAVLADGHLMPGAKWFPEARLNFAENLLRRRDDNPAILFRGERGGIREMSHAGLYDLVSRLAAALAAAGIGPGDRVAGYLPNIPEAIAAMLATASLGATWSSCSPDFGVQGVLDRFGQIEPRVLFAADGYFYNGARIDRLEPLAQIVDGLETLERVIVVPFAGGGSLDNVRNALSLDAFLRPFQPGPIRFRQLPFDHPLYILFSSGTTGIPKCIVHGAGGTLLQHLKEHLLHTDVKPGDRLFYFTTLGWMMWNWLASGLAAGATLLLYDGSPFYPDGNVLFDFADEAAMTQMGISAKFIDALAKAGLSPKGAHDLTPLRTMLSTGSPLMPESFDFVYQHIKADLCLSSISGGTDIISCFVLGNPAAPVWRGEIQASGLGMDMAVFDDEGRPLRGKPGELVCRAPFPSLPVSFWDDPDGARYRAAYFERFPDTWCHGDWAEMTDHDGIIIYGRSDAVLNPGGVRIGTAEIYRQVEQLDEVVEGLAVGQQWDGDTRIVLFVRLADGAELNDDLRSRIRDRLRAHASPRHVPAVIAAVADIPRTKSGKITELAVRDVIHGRPVANLEALANPEALAYFRDREELSG